jgi:DNA-3-methyladenine glycosylase
LHIDRTHSGADLDGDTLWIERPAGAWRKPKISRATRIGVDYAGSWALKPWRFFEAESPYVSTVSAAQRRRLIGLSAASSSGSRAPVRRKPSRGSGD